MQPLFEKKFKKFFIFFQAAFSGEKSIENPV